MPLYRTASEYSGFKRSNNTSSAFNNHTRTKPSSSPISRKRKHPTDESSDDDDNGDDATDILSSTNSKPIPLSPAPHLKTVPEAIAHALDNIFSPIPPRASGLSSTQTSSLLNFRRSLPPIISLAHIHALLPTNSSTKIEREIASLITGGTLRKIPISGRGNSVSGLGEFLIRSADLEELIDASPALKPETKTYFKTLLRDNPRATNLSARTLHDAATLTALVKAGFLVTASAHAKISSGTGAATTQFSTPVATASRTPAGRAVPVSDSSFENLRAGASTEYHTSTASLTLSVPNLGPYTRLLASARSHLLDLLSKSKSGKQASSSSSSAPAYLLQERWDGAVDPDANRVAAAKKLRGDWTGMVLPAKTKKWKRLAGLQFQWVLEECLGAGLVEGFETGSVGLGVRVV